MPVKISIKGDKETNEFKDALVLKEIFEKEFTKKDTNGEILIISSATLFGQDTQDIDLIVLGNFENYSCKVKSKAETGTYKDKKELELKERWVYINSFCFVIETKRHRAEDIQLNGIQLLVRYNNKLHDVTTQSEKQKYSLKSFIEDRLNFSPYVCNFIWFRNIDWGSIKQLLGNNESALTKHNYLPNSFSLPFLFQLACVQSTPYNAIDDKGQPKPSSSFKCLKKNQSFDFNEMQSTFELFEKVKAGMGQLTRKKIEQITSKLLDNQQYAQAIGEKFIIISGRAGTGKTIKLLRIACDLAVSKGARCLILTYNHALVSDIKRTLALAEIPDGVDTYTVNITTIHKFFFELLIGFGIVKSVINPSADIKYIPDYIEKYDKYLKELYDYVDNGLIQEKEIQELMRSRHDKVAWDYILIDESQDCDESEKSILFRIFGKEKVIIADGVDQLVRTQKKCNWISGLKPDIDFKKTNEKKGLRQEVNLVSFINSYAKELGIRWELEPKQELIGGKIIISTKEYSKELHQREVNRCKEFGNTEYEMMFLVPPNLVSVLKTEKGEARSFKLKNEFNQMGINIWDSTSKDLRSQYVVDLTQHRLLQYESCRGLEGWTVVCLHLDEFIKYKMETFTEMTTEELALESFEEKRDKFVYLWSLIPLTRAIDTLVITIKNKDSKVGKALRKVYEQNPDFVQWIE
jgi:hypothetical protein